MVLGIKSKNKKGVFFKLDYIVHVREIRPWPPSETLKCVQTVLLQWENGEKSSGSFLSVAGDSNISFNESFVLSITLYQKSPDKFKKNYLEFSLFEPRKDKAKGHLLATAVLNIAEYGLVEDVVSVTAPLNFKKTTVTNNSIEPALFISIEPVERDSPNSSPSTGLSKAPSFNDDDSEVASFTDDDASSHSSRTAGSSSFEAMIASPSPNEVGLRNLRSASTRAPSDSWNKVNKYVTSFKFAERSMSYIKRNTTSPLVISSPISVSSTIPESVFSSIASDKSSYEETVHKTDHSKKESSSHSLYSVMRTDDANDGNERRMSDKFTQSSENKLNGNSSDDVIKRQAVVTTRLSIPAIPQPPNGTKARLKHATSVSIKGNGHQTDSYDSGKSPDIAMPKGSRKNGKLSAETESKEEKIVKVSDNAKEWRQRVESLEEELKETAVIEMALYATLPEHSSSRDKVHSPARRLSRFYTNACREGPQAKRASAARAIVSGLILVSRACGGDVSRLSFWLSNSIMLRSIVSETASLLPHCNGGKTAQEQSKPAAEEESDDWEDVLTFIIALEKVESWLFSRIVESLWWQSFMPHMQPPTVTRKNSRSKSSNTKKRNLVRRNNTLGYHEQSNTSIELWKKAFKDACERLCPVLAGGHKCGCLNSLVRLVMEQLVNRLDTVMFNAILRESAEEIPTDPVNDPVSSFTVLPVPAGKSSFGAGAQLKNAIGNWSRLLTDLIGLEDGDTLSRSQPFKAFRLLHALSDLMMLPFGMLADTSTRKEVCPTLGPAIIKRVLKNFVPDDFCPGPVPSWIIDVLNSEEITDTSADAITSYPCSASPTKYSPPSAQALLCCSAGEQMLKSDDNNKLKKSFASDDEIDEAESSLTSIIPDSYQSNSALAKLGSMPKEKGGGNIVRYQLLREIWRDDDE